jgi:aflatoxin B1 aldehyde reductase
MKVAIPRAYLGTMTFAWSSQTSSVVDEPVAIEMVHRFIKFQQELGVDSYRIDTARVYAGGNTEPMVGAVLKKLDPAWNASTKTNILVGTKAHPSVKPGGLSPSGIQDQLSTSLDAMGLDSIEEYYLHQPDTEHSLLDSLKYAHSLVEQGKIKTIGMSNYHASEMARAFALCKEHNLTPPRVYQGLYNPLNRLVEVELLPILNDNGCSFVAYNPLAAGLLTGKHLTPDSVSPGRFKNNENYLPRFYTSSNFEAINLIRTQCEVDGISMVEATYRWLLCHSALSPDKDGFLLGASSLEQLDQNLAACLAAATKEKLSPAMLSAFDRAWELTKDGAFPYWRSYSSDMPNREALDPGASYNAAKAK